MSKLKPTEAELEILQILWKHGASTVRFVNEKLNEKKRSGLYHYPQNDAAHV